MCYWDCKFTLKNNKVLAVGPLERFLMQKLAYKISTVTDRPTGQAALSGLRSTLRPRSRSPELMGYHDVCHNILSRRQWDRDPFLMCSVHMSEGDQVPTFIVKKKRYCILLTIPNKQPFVHCTTICRFCNIGQIPSHIHPLTRVEKNHFPAFDPNFLAPTWFS